MRPETLLTTRTLLGYLWDATGKDPKVRVRDLFADDDPLVADVGRVLAAAEAAPEIDVKRLARALATPWPDSFSPFGYSDPLWRRALAEALAAAYRADPLDERTS
jgi:hypothetical protein